jgi:hypothetical protein
MACSGPVLDNTEGPGPGWVRKRLGLHGTVAGKT